MKSLRFLFPAILMATACAAQPDEATSPKPRNPPTTTAPQEQAYTPEKTAHSADRKGEDVVTKGLGPELISAAGRGDAEAVESLLNRGANLEARDENGRTALIAAAYGNHLGAAGRLVGAGADVNAKDDTVQSAYLISTSEVGDDPRLLNLTLEHGADVRSLDSYNGTGLIRAAERGYAKIIERLLQTDIDVNHVNDLQWTALLEAIILGDGGPAHTEVVRLLVQEGAADPNLPDGDGVTPLQHARRNGYKEIVEILEEAGGR